MTLSDFTGGMLLAQAILLALVARERTGRGQVVETSILDGMLAMQAWETTSRLNTPPPAAASDVPGGRTTDDAGPTSDAADAAELASGGRRRAAATRWTAASSARATAT
jgi:crotonobetainyl-CoA:carnitine CoA-transferase CaiB-like acyl-CoA transferase